MALRVQGWATWIADHEVWPLVAGVAVAALAPRWAGWGLGLLAALWGVRWAARGQPSVRTPIDGPAFLMMAMAAASIWVSTDRAVTLVALGRLVAGLALTYGLANWAGGDRARLALLGPGFGGLGLGLALFALVSVTWPARAKLPGLAGGLYAPLPPLLVGDTVNPNMMAGALVMALPYSLAPLLVPRGTQPGWICRAWCAAAALGAAVVLLLTKSRGAWIATGAALYVLLVWRWRRAWWVGPIALLALGVLVWWVGPGAVVDPFAGGGALSGWESRAEIWRQAVYLIQDHPYTGAGANTFGAVADALYPSFLRGPDAGVPHAHNLLLQVAVDLGILGLVAFLAITILAFWAAIKGGRRYRRAGDAALAALAWACVASLVGMLVHGQVDATTWIVGRGAFVPWATIGIALALARRPVEEGEDTRDGAQ